MKTITTIIAALALLLTVSAQADACISPGTYSQAWGLYSSGTAVMPSGIGVGSYLGCPGCPGCPDGNGTPANPGDPGCLACGCS